VQERASEAEFELPRRQRGNGARPASAGQQPREAQRDLQRVLEIVVAKVAFLVVGIPSGKCIFDVSKKRSDPGGERPLKHLLIQGLDGGGHALGAFRVDGSHGRRSRNHF